MPMHRGTLPVLEVLVRLKQENSKKGFQDPHIQDPHCVRPERSVTSRVTARTV